jgi:protein-S-isoprenylcysteine O-methyltransferase Ste14
MAPLSWGPIVYGLAFIVALPLLLVSWAIGAQPQVLLPTLGSSALGAALVAVGAGLFAAGIISIMRYGEGLPMNAFPPSRHVTRGAYRITAHPIYTGFALLSFGAAMIARSSSGFWLVAPSVTLGCAALVLGHERIDLERRFGRPEYRPCLSLPPVREMRPSGCERASVYVLVFLPWLAIYEALAAVGPPPNAVSAYLPFERMWPVLEWTEAIYASTYLFVLLVPLAAKNARDLRIFAVDGLVATGVAAFLWFVVPLVASPRLFMPSGSFGRLLLSERSHDVAWNAFPSFHVTWAFLAYRIFASRWPKLRPLWLALTGSIAVSCVTTGMHGVADVVAGAVLFLVASRRKTVWEWLRLGAEKVANSWREWRMGPVRLINHSLYAGLSGFIAIGCVASLLGVEALPAALLVAALGIVGAAFGGQLIEGSPKLLRPYGYFGAVAGVIGGSVAASILFRIDAWRLAAAFCIAAPWIVVAGRLRCLIQGCCHGSPAPAWLGISYTHPTSRVCRLTGLGGIPVHATPLYSILWNTITGALVFRLWFVRAPLSIVVGAYFLLAGLGRFVEEAYRGEPQTPMRWGLRIYQWLAVASAAGGALVTTARTAPADGGFHSSPAIAVAAISFGLFAAAAYGVDFPKSTARFARLT